MNSSPARVLPVETWTYLKFKVPYTLPSLNALFGKQHWARLKEKKKAQAACLSGLKAAAQDSSTQITSAQNTWSIASDTLASYMETARQTSKSKSRKPKSKRAKNAQ